MSHSNVRQFAPKAAVETSGFPNPVMPLDLDWVSRVRVNRSAVQRRCSTLSGRRTVKKQWQAAWLLRAMTCIDLTTLDGADTPGNVNRLCTKGAATSAPGYCTVASGRRPHSKRCLRLPPL